MMSYEDFYNKQKELSGCYYRIVGELNGQVVKSCWRKNTFFDLAKKPAGKMKIMGIEIKS